MKLTGEYELRDGGVTIEGKIHDSHIHEIRTLLKPFKTIRIYKGDIEQLGQVYHVPHPSYRPYLMRKLPEICNPNTEKDFVTLPKRLMGENAVYYRDCGVFYNNMGMFYMDGDGRTPMDNRRVFQYHSLQRNKTRLLTNSAWVWGADESGNFKVDLYGMVNRHMMTVILANATRLAKYIDTVLVRTLDHAEEFTAENIASASARISPYDNW